MKSAPLLVLLGSVLLVQAALAQHDPLLAAASLPPAAASLTFEAMIPRSASIVC